MTRERDSASLLKTVRNAASAIERAESEVGVTVVPSMGVRLRAIVRSMARLKLLGRRESIPLSALLARAPAEDRLSIMIGLSREDPAALDEILRRGEADGVSASDRHNLIVTLGFFARHSMTADVLSEERLGRVRRALDGMGETK